MEPARIPYGDHPEQLGELTLPEGATAGEPAPVVALWHGGSFQRAYDLDQMRPLAADLAAHGLAAWNLEYRRLGCDGGWPATFDDARAGLDHLATSDAPLDLDRVAGVGLSAGAALLLHVAARPGRVRLRAAVGQGGLSDFAAAANLFGDPRVAEADPTRDLPFGIPMLHVFGAADDVIPVADAERFSAAARAAGDSSEVRVVPGDHYIHMDPSSEAWSTAWEWVSERLAQRLYDRGLRGPLKHLATDVSVVDELIAERREEARREDEREAAWRKAHP
jgi:acetyl esterase/lipase